MKVISSFSFSKPTLFKTRRCVKVRSIGYTHPPARVLKPPPQPAPIEYVKPDNRTVSYSKFLDLIEHDGINIVELIPYYLSLLILFHFCLYSAFSHF